MSSLFVIQGRDQGKRFELGEPLLSIGRDPLNGIRLNDTEVSRRHAELRRTDEGTLWVDLKSSNGSFVNSLRVHEQLLRSGDRIQIGRTLMIFTDATDAPSAITQREVDIVGQSGEPPKSRIVSSLAHDSGSHFLAGFEDHEDSAWLARARSNLQVMYRTALAVSHTMDIDQLLQRIMELIFEWVEADRGCVMLMDRETDELIPKVRQDRHTANAEQRMEISRTILDYVCSNQEGVLTSDAREDERWDPAASIVKLGVREAICVPMQGRYGVVGVIYIDTFTPPGSSLRFEGGPKRFQEEHLKLMIAIGHQAALAVEDTSYYSAMVQAERLAAMGQTIAGLSHHVKNILQGIRGGSFLIEEGLKAQDWDVTRKGWKIVEKNQERISSLVLDMLTFSKEREPDLVPGNLNDVVGDVLELMRVRAAEHQVTLVDQRAEEIPVLTFDPDGIHRAVLNVVTNAIDACAARAEDGPDHHGQVVVETEYAADDRQLRVRVRDNGPGISAEEQSRIFNVFVSSKGQRGTGLGLPVSQKILREHGGDIRVESEPGHGCCFICEIPAIRASRETGSI